MRVLLANNLEGHVFQEDQCLHFHLHLSRDLDSLQRRLEVLKMISILALKGSARISIWKSKFSFFVDDPDYDLSESETDQLCTA